MDCFYMRSWWDLTGVASELCPSRATIELMLAAKPVADAVLEGTAVPGIRSVADLSSSRASCSPVIVDFVRYRMGLLGS